MFKLEGNAMKTLILLAGVALAATAAVAEPTTKTVTVDRPNYDATRVIVRDKEAGTLTRETDIIRERDGATASRDYSRTRTDSGVVASGSATGFAGRTSSFDYSRTRTDTGYVASGTATGKGGRTYSYDAERIRNGSGFTAEQTVTGPKGRTLYDRDVAVTRSGGNVTRSVDVTRAKGFHRPQGLGRGIGGARRR
jgi:hypothetical protein